MNIERKSNKEGECISSKIINADEYKLLLKELKTMDNGFELVKSKNTWKLVNDKLNDEKDDGDIDE